MPAPSPFAATPTNQRHRPEQTALYSIVSEHYPRFVQEIERAGGHLPGFVRPPGRSRVSRSARSSVRADVSVSAAIPVRGPAGRIDSGTGGGPARYLDLPDPPRGLASFGRRPHRRRYPDPALRLRSEPECSPTHAVP